PISARRVVRARQADRLTRDARTPGRERDRVERPERRTRDDEVVDDVPRADRRQYLFNEIALVGKVLAGAVLRGHGLVVEGLAVHRVDAPELEPAGLHTSRQATSASRQPLIAAVFPCSSSLYVAKNVSISRRQCAARSSSLVISSNRGSPTGTARIFSSFPCSSSMNSVPTGRARTTQPGK